MPCFHRQKIRKDSFVWSMRRRTKYNFNCLSIWLFWSFLFEFPDKHLGKWLHFDDPTKLRGLGQNGLTHFRVAKMLADWSPMVDVVASELVPTKLEAPKFMWNRFQIYGLRNTVLVEHTPKWEPCICCPNLDEIQWEDTQYQPLLCREWTSFMLTVEHHCVFFLRQVQCSCNTAWEQWTQDILLWLLQCFLAPKATSRILHVKNG